MVRSITFKVEIQRGSVGPMNFTSGISRQEASTALEPLCCTKDFSSGSQKFS